MDDPFQILRVERLPVGDHSMKRRAAGQTALELLHRAANIRRVGLLLGLINNAVAPVNDDDVSDDDADDDDDEAADIEDEEELYLIIAIWSFLEIKICDAPKDISIRSIVRNAGTVDNYSDDECWRLLRFRKSDVTKLLELLEFPPYLVGPDRHKHPRGFAFILHLRRMAYPGRLTVLETEFGREFTALSRCFNLTIEWLDANHSHRIIAFWMSYQQIYANAVAAKVDVPANYANVNSFLNGTQKSVCRPSDGDDRPLDVQGRPLDNALRHGCMSMSLQF